VRLDDRSFVLTGNEAGASTSRTLFETSLPGVFAVGDVRSGSVTGRLRCRRGICRRSGSARPACRSPAGGGAQVGHSDGLYLNAAPARLGPMGPAAEWATPKRWRCQYLGVPQEPQSPSLHGALHGANARTHCRHLIRNVLRWTSSTPTCRHAHLIARIG
jgi:hypothetical protein